MFTVTKEGLERVNYSFLQVLYFVFSKCSCCGFLLLCFFFFKDLLHCVGILRLESSCLGQAVLKVDSASSMPGLHVFVCYF